MYAPLIAQRQPHPLAPSSDPDTCLVVWPCCHYTHMRSPIRPTICPPICPPTHPQVSYLADFPSDLAMAAACPEFAPRPGHSKVDNNAIRWVKGLIAEAEGSCKGTDGGEEAKGVAPWSTSSCGRLPMSLLLRTGASQQAPCAHCAPTRPTPTPHVEHCAAASTARAYLRKRIVLAAAQISSAAPERSKPRTPAPFSCLP